MVEWIAKIGLRPRHGMKTSGKSFDTAEFGSSDNPSIGPIEKANIDRQIINAQKIGLQLPREIIRYIIHDFLLDHVEIIPFAAGGANHPSIRLMIPENCGAYIAKAAQYVVQAHLKNSGK